MNSEHTEPGDSSAHDCREGWYIEGDRSGTRQTDTDRSYALVFSGSHGVQDGAPVQTERH